MPAERIGFLVGKSHPWPARKTRRSVELRNLQRPVRVPHSHAVRVGAIAQVMGIAADGKKERGWNRNEEAYRCELIFGAAARSPKRALTSERNRFQPRPGATAEPGNRRQTL